MRNRNDVKRFLIRQEGKELSGNNRKNMFLLSGVFFLSMLSIAFACASLSYLMNKMDDKFVNSVDIVVDQRGEWYNLDNFISDGIDSIGLESVEKVYFDYVKFRKVKDTTRTTPQLDGRTCLENSLILENNILSNQNVVRRSKKKWYDSEMLLIVTVDALKRLNLDTNAVFLEKTYYDWHIHDFLKPFSIPIYAVVKELPNMRDFLYTQIFLKKIRLEGDRALHEQVMSEKLNKEMYICVSGEKKEKLKDLVKQDSCDFYEAPYDIVYAPDYWKISIISKDDGSRVAIYDSLFSKYSAKIDGLARIYDFDCPKNELEDKPEIISCYFKRDSLFQNVEKFSVLMKDNTGYRLDMGKINSLKNLAMVQIMGIGLSVIILIISILFLCIFIYKLLKSHFEKIRMNLGTFKAFGVANKMLIRIYVRIVLVMIVYAYLMALFLSCVVSGVLPLMGFEIESGYSYLKVFYHPYYPTLVLFVVSLLASWVTTRKVARDMFSQTPGDLIYNRNKK